MPPLIIAIFLLSCLVGAVIQATTGFGFGIFVMAIFPHILSSYAQSAALSSICAATMSAMVVIRYGKHINFKLILPLLVGYSVAAILSVQYAKAQSEGFMVRLLGAVLILLSIYFLFFCDKICIKPTFLNGVLAGVLGGVGSGLFSIGGPPVVIYLMSATTDKDEYRACSLLYFTVSSTYVTAVRWANGLLSPETVYLWLLAIAALGAGSYIGNRIFHRINAGTLKRLVYGFMAISGVTMLF